MAINYHMEILTQGDIKEGGKIVIPSYQRGIVWSLKHKKEFLETVKNGDPIGVVLVYKEQDGKYTLIDGLQRLSTLKAYMANPLSFIDEKDKFINETLIEEIIKEKFKISGANPPSETNLAKLKKQFKKKLLESMKDTEKLPDGEDVWFIMRECFEYPDSTLLMSKFIKFYRSFEGNLKLDDDVKIQAIVYDGDKDNLPNVFHNLNTGSVSLTKYEIYASIWPKTKIVFEDEEILNKVINKYSNLKNNSNFEVEISEDDLRQNGLTLFEYCYSISEILNDQSKDYSYLFNTGKKSSEPVGFDLLALVCGQAVNKSQSLYENKQLGGASAQFLIDLKNALVDSVSIVSNSLKKWLFDYHKNNLVNDSLYQIYHMIIAVFKNRYSIDLEQKIISKKTDSDSINWINRFKKYAFKHYIYDTYTNFWSINRQVSDLKREIESSSSISKYIFNISSDSLKNELTSFVDDTMSKCTGSTADNTTKMLLNYYYKLKEQKYGKVYFKESDEVKQGDVIYTFDIEHIVPKNYFERFPNLTLPKSFIGNLCYLSIKDNRSKKDLTLYEYSDQRIAYTINDDFVKFVNYPKREDLNFIYLSEQEFKNGYESFIKKRSSEIVEELASLISETDN